MQGSSGNRRWSSCQLKYEREGKMMQGGNKRHKERWIVAISTRREIPIQPLKALVFIILHNFFLSKVSFKLY